MKYRDPETGLLKDIVLPAGGDTLPIGTIVNYDGEDVPKNYELVEGGDILNTQSSSTIDTYSCDYINTEINNVEIPSVIDNLTSTDTANALSANRGRLLNNALNNKLDAGNVRRFTGSIGLSTNTAWLIAVQVFSTVGCTLVGTCLAGYDISVIGSKNISMSRSGATYSFSSGYGACLGVAIRLG